MKTFTLSIVAAFLAALSIPIACVGQVVFDADLLPQNGSGVTGSISVNYDQGSYFASGNVISAAFSLSPQAPDATRVTAAKFSTANQDFWAVLAPSGEHRGSVPLPAINGSINSVFRSYWFTFFGDAFHVDRSGLNVIQLYSDQTVVARGVVEPVAVPEPEAFTAAAGIGLVGVYLFRTRS